VDPRARRAVRDLRRHAALGSEFADDIVSYSRLREGEQALDAGDVDEARQQLNRVTEAGYASDRSWTCSEAEALLTLLKVVPGTGDWSSLVQKLDPLTDACGGRGHDCRMRRRTCTAVSGLAHVC
jgi:hypothetical protein